MRRVQYEIRTRKLDGSPYFAHDLVVGGRVVRSQLSPYDAEEAAALARYYQQQSDEEAS